MNKKVVLFDLGNTLVRYYDRGEFPVILSEALERVASYLRASGLCGSSLAEVITRADKENYEGSDHCVRPLEGRLSRIFELGNAVDAAHVGCMCRQFMIPIFAKARVYTDTLDVLATLRAKNIRTAIISNSPWGSPSYLWREEIARHGLDAYVDEVIFCCDAGWRKPARQIFDHALAKLDAKAEECLFVGDDPRWDLVGPRRAGIDAVLIDRAGSGCTDPPTVTNLRAILQWL